MQTTKLNFLKIFVLIGILLCLMSYNYAQSGANLNTFVKHLVAGGGGGGDDGDDDGDDNGDNDGDDDGDDNGDDDGDWGWNDSIPNWTEPTVDELIEQLIAAGYGECLTDAPEFASVDEVYNYVYENCMDDWDGDNGWG
ncbi:MAG TPA: hypothetical protein PKH93_13165, partial [Chitinophagales bacterium]|nr:hypothetical protein [Chitinophagales bacterium]